ncbi:MULTISPECIES: hypothetical protein [unclassified Tessaracoccus]|uniref:hypothetical protein n=1 Tax=unclassified Tessaracoccus TaxID=2635419 RepID=UPI001300EA94|nr:MULTISPECIES: hypothetical protein [unclassified Tessaracoccus]MBB1510540.1 hypothetical protein [Tessaracoccus sp. MC1756]
MSTENREQFDVEKYQAEHKQPSEAESAILTVLLFVSMVVFAVGCTMFGWFQ